MERIRLGIGTVNANAGPELEDGSANSKNGSFEIKTSSDFDSSDNSNVSLVGLAMRDNRGNMTPVATVL